MNTTKHKPQRVTLGTFIKVPAYRFGGMTIRANLHSAAWRRLWWVCDYGRHPMPVRRAVVEARGWEWDDEGSASQPVSFPSLQAACAAIATATGSTP